MEIVKKKLFMEKKLHHKYLVGGPIRALETNCFIADKVFCSAVA